MNEGDRPHRFQSFWYGGPLSPYESFCLKSFIDCGHAFDLEGLAAAEVRGQHPVDGWAGEYDEQTLEHALGRKAELNELAQQLRAEIGMRGEERARLQGELEAMQASTSWRLTAPLRAGRRHLRALRALGKRR